LYAYSPLGIHEVDHGHALLAAQHGVSASIKCEHTVYCSRVEAPSTEDLAVRADRLRFPSRHEGLS
jgi:hypothetical protein